MRFKEILLEEQNKKDETVEEELRWYRVQHGLLHDVFLRAGKKGADELRSDGEENVREWWNVFTGGQYINMLRALWVEAKGLTGLLIQFPRPRRQTEAWFAFMHYNNHEPKDYWTLELGEDLCEEEGVLCAWNDEKQHRNYGLFIRPDPFVFLAAIRNKLDQSESDHEMLLSLHDYVEA